jgi:hypothetical protein
MPLARIITRFPESSKSLAAELKARGFDVETTSPEAFPSELADLELRVEECSAEEALRRATQPGEPERSVLVASGTITPEMAPLAVFPFFRELAVPAEPAKGTFQVSEPAQVQGGLIEAAVPTTEHPALTPQLSEPGAIESASQGTALSDLEPPERPENVPVMNFQNDNSSQPQNAISQIEASELGGQIQPEASPIEAEPGFDSVPTTPSAATIQAQTKYPELQEFTETRAHASEPEWEKQAPSWSAHTPGGEDLPAPVLNQREDQQLGDGGEQASALEANAEPAVWQRAEPTSDWPIWNPLLECEPGDGAAIEASQIPVQDAWAEHQSYSAPLGVDVSLISGPASGFGSSGMLHGLSGDERIFWKTAAVAAVFAIAVLLLGVFAHRISPIPAGLVQNSETDQQPPLLKSKHNTNASEGNRVLLTVSEPAETKTPDKIDSMTATSQVHTTHSQVNLASSKPRETTKPQVRPARVASEFVAEDTVVRFGDRANPAGSAPARPTKAGKRSEVKHYSDLD